MESPVVLRDDRKGLELPQVKETLISSTRKVASALGTGRRESAYQCALKIELQKSIGGSVMLEYPIAILYESERVGVSYLDILLLGNFFVEVKATAKIGGKDVLQAQAYARDSGLLGALVNFKQSATGGVEFVLVNGSGKLKT